MITDNKKRNKVFIPMSIDQSTTYKTGYFMSPLKMSLAILFWIPSIILSFYAYSNSGNTWQVALISFIIYMFFYSFFFRYVVMEEKRLKRLLRNLEDNKISTNEYFWGIEEIDDDGVIHYRYNKGLKKAVIIKVNRGSLIGVDENFNERYKETNLEFIRGLLRNKFSYFKYSRLERSEMPEGIRDYIQKLNQIEDDAQRAVMKMNIDTMNKFTKENKNVIVDYYVIMNTDIRLMKSFKFTIRDLLFRCYGNEIYFNGTKILKLNDVLKFLSEVLNVNNISRKGYYDNSSVSFEDFGTVFRLFDYEGQEVDVDLEKEFSRSRKDEALGSKYGYSLDQMEKKLNKQDSEETESIFSKEEVYDNDLSIDEMLRKKEEAHLLKLKSEEVEELVLYEDDDGNLIDEDGNMYDTEGNMLKSAKEIYEDKIKLSEDVDLFKNL